MQDDPLDPVWKALANPVRRKMLDLMRDEPLTTGDLAAAFPELSRFAVMQHLSVLEDSGLLVVKRVGRQRFNYLNAVPIRQIYERWVSRYEGHWASALLALRDSVEREEHEKGAQGGASGTASPPGESATGRSGVRKSKKKAGARRKGSAAASKRRGKGGSHD